MTEVVHSLPDHCPGYDISSPYPSLKFRGRRCQKSNYITKSSLHGSYFCGGGDDTFTEDISTNKFSKTLPQKPSVVPAEQQTPSPSSISTLKEVNLCVLPYSIDATRCADNTEKLCRDILYEIKQLLVDINEKDKNSKKSSVQALPYFSWYSDGIKGQQQTTTVAPFVSLNSYFEKLANGINLSVEEKMVYEALRLQSFHNVNTSLSAVNLAKCGFFATGNENETRCYSCGIIYNNWRRTDDPHLLHNRMSPTCRHVNGTDCRNIPLSRPSALTVQSAAECVEDRVTPAESIEPSDNVSEATSQILAAHKYSRSSENYRFENETEIVTDSAAGATKSEEDVTGVPSTYGNVFLSSLPTLHFEKAVYPNYSEIKIRLESFQLWPGDHCKTPAELVHVGFFYAGYADCVRCFVCGVGLRTWEEGDDPWAEHIRWRSSCDFVSKIKGQEFVIETLAALGRQMTEANQQNETCRDLAAGINKLSVKQSSQEVPKLLEQSSLQLSGQLTHDVTPLSERTITPEDTPGDDGVTAADNSDSTQCKTHNTDNKGQTEETRLVTKRKMDNECNEPLSLQAAVEENRQIRESSLCKICLDEMANIVFLPCGHLIACVTCSPALERCPLCRQHIRGTVRVHLATMTSLKSTI